MGLFAELGVGVCRRPALPLVVTKLGGTVLCPCSERRSFGGSRVASMRVFLSYGGNRECVPGCGTGSRPAQHTFSVEPKPFQKFPGIFPILQ